jgi:hypothetical protein
MYRYIRSIYHLAKIQKLLFFKETKMQNTSSSTQLNPKKSFFVRSIRNKLVLIIIIIAFIPLTIVGGVAINQLYVAKNAANEVSENYLPSIINLNNAALALMHVVEAQKNHIIAPDDATMRALETEIKTSQKTIANALLALKQP